MNIIEQIKTILSDCPLMTEFCNGLHVDFNSNTEGDFGLYSNGDLLLKEDILGNQKRRHNFVLYANNASINDFDRLANSSFLLNLGYWLEAQKGAAVSAVVAGREMSGTINKISASNAMLFSVPTGNIKDGVTYQIQIYAEYDLKS